MAYSQENPSFEPAQEALSAALRAVSFAEDTKSGAGKPAPLDPTFDEYPEHDRKTLVDFCKTWLSFIKGGLTRLATEVDTIETAIATTASAIQGAEARRGDAFTADDKLPSEGGSLAATSRDSDNRDNAIESSIGRTKNIAQPLGWQGRKLRNGTGSYPSLHCALHA